MCWAENDGRLVFRHANPWGLADERLRTRVRLPMIQAIDLTKTFHPPRGKPVEAVRSVSFTVQPGEVYGLLGPNGAGKTSLLRMLGTIITPTSGHCLVDGARSDADPEAVRRRVGFMSGNTKLYRRLSGRETLRYFGRLHGMAAESLEARIEELIGAFNLEAFVDRRCDSYSTGQMQRVSIARVMLHDPPVLILDEPTLGLDIMSSRTMLDFVGAARDRGCAVIFSTHYMTEAELLCDRIGFIYAGRLLAEGTTAELYTQTGTTNLKDAFLNMADEADAAGPMSDSETEPKA